MSRSGSILITGANGGLGSALAAQVASNPNLSAHYGLYVVRDAASATDLASALRTKAADHRCETLSLDLTRLDQVRAVSRELNAQVASGQIPPIRALILGAGFQDFGKQEWTSDGYDVTFSANYLGHWLLTLLLLQSMDREHGTLVVVGSQAHDPFDKRNSRTKAFVDEKYQNFARDPELFHSIAKGSWSSAKEDASFVGGFRRYAASRLFLIMMIHELRLRMDRQPELTNIRIFGVDPGAMSTGLQRRASWVIRVLLFKIIMPTVLYLFPDNGQVQAPATAASILLSHTFRSGDVADTLYYSNAQPMETSLEARNAEKRAMVWAETVKDAQLQVGETCLKEWE